MRRLVGPAIVLVLAACSSPPAEVPAPRSQQAVATPKPATLPAGVSACGVLDEVRDGKRCRTFDTTTGTFVEADAFTRRAYLYERWLDLHVTPEGQVANRMHARALAPDEAEASWSDESIFTEWAGFGDSSLWTHTALIAAALRYASTGTDADYARMEEYARAALRFFDATGAEGYQARFVFAGVTPGTRIRPGYAMAGRSDDDAIMFDVAAAAKAELPAYFTDGIPDGAGGTTPVRATWRGWPSIDQYSGPIASLPIVVPLLKDRTLASRLVRHFDCFAKRLRVFRITHLSENPEVAHAVGSYLAGTATNVEPGDPDLSKVDEIWAFFLPQKNKANAASYAACPASLAFDLDDEDHELDARDPQFQGKLVDLMLRMDSATRADALDFGFFPSVRSGDALQMLDIAQAGYTLTGDAEYLRWYDELLVGRIKAADVARTYDAFGLPKPCTSYYREHNVYMTEYAALLTMPPGAERDRHAAFFHRDLGHKLGPTGNPLFEIALAGATGTPSDRLDHWLGELRTFGGTDAHLDSPRRNYDTDNVSSPPAGVMVAAPNAEEKRICEAGVTMFGITIPGETVDATERYSDVALPLMRRLNEDFNWQRDPFNAVRAHGDTQGREQYPGLDLTLAYWAARYHGLLGAQSTVLAWGPVE